MRSPGRKRNVPSKIAPSDDVDYDRIATEVRYVGSPEHKTYPSFAGPPSPRPDASICPDELKDEQDMLTAWLQEAIQNKAVGSYTENGYPRYAWYKDDDTVYLARLVNRGNGTYKGFPIEKSEWPDGIDEYYD
jgi:hypothetical protein